MLTVCGGGCLLLKSCYFRFSSITTLCFKRGRFTLLPAKVKKMMVVTSNETKFGCEINKRGMKYFFKVETLF